MAGLYNASNHHFRATANKNLALHPGFDNLNVYVGNSDAADDFYWLKQQHEAVGRLSVFSFVPKRWRSFGDERAEFITKGGWTVDEVALTGPKNEAIHITHYQCFVNDARELHNAYYQHGGGKMLETEKTRSAILLHCENGFTRSLTFATLHAMSCNGNGDWQGMHALIRAQRDPSLKGVVPLNTAYQKVLTTAAASAKRERGVCFAFV